MGHNVESSCESNYVCFILHMTEERGSVCMYLCETETGRERWVFYKNILSFSSFVISHNDMNVPMKRVTGSIHVNIDRKPGLRERTCIMQRLTYRMCSV